MRWVCLWGLLRVGLYFQRPREILVWGRQPNNNKVLEAREIALCHIKALLLRLRSRQFYGNELERWDAALRKLMSKSVLPQGSLRARIRATSREVRHARDGTLGDTLGEERLGMVIVETQPAPRASSAHHVT